MKFVDIKTDYAFRKIFGDEKHKPVLISFLNSVLNLEGKRLINDVNILNPYQLPKVAILKETILDVSCRDNMNQEYIVEMQVFNNVALHKRILYYASKRYSEQLLRGEDYPKLNQVIFIGLMDFELFSYMSSKYKSIHKIMDEETKNIWISDLLFILIELPKFTKKLDELKTIEDKWYYFIKNAGNLTIEPDELKNEKPIEEALFLASQGNWTPEELDVYIKRQIYLQDEKERIQFGYTEGFSNGEKKGFQNGEKKGFSNGEKKGFQNGEKKGFSNGEKNTKLKIVMSMLEMNIDINTISKITELSIEEIKNIISNK